MQYLFGFPLLYILLYRLGYFAVTQTTVNFRTLEFVFTLTKTDTLYLGCATFKFKVGVNALLSQFIFKFCNTVYLFDCALYRIVQFVL